MGLRQPGGRAGGKRTIFSTTGHWVMASKSKNQDAAWELVKFLSSPAFANEFGAHYGWAPVRSDVNTSKGDAPGHACQQVRPERLGRPADRPEDGAADERLRPGDRGRGTGSKSVKAAMAKAQADGTRILKS